jgi:cytochrome c-type biogenesis protein
MELTFTTFVLLPIALGLLGFIEPCTVGSHLVFLGTQEHRSRSDKLRASIVFAIVRAVIAGLIGALIAFAGQSLIEAQTGIWMFFGLVYAVLGLAFLVGGAGFVKRRLEFTPSHWRQARSPFVLGLAFGLNIPACAAPILFGLLGLAATSGTVLAGFMMMALFGLALSAPLIAFAAVPSLRTRLDAWSARARQTRWTLGLVFILLGLWSMWFGFYVDPADWSGR